MFFDYEKEEQKQQQAAKGRRFEIRHESSEGSGMIRIIVDRETGVNYLAYSTAEGVGLTVLVDADGKPVKNKDNTNAQ